MSDLKEMINAFGASEIGQTAVSHAEEFLQNVFKEPGLAFGGLMTDKINFRRFKNLVHIVAEARRLLRELGLTERDVPLKIIHPLLEAASLEEEPDLVAMFSNLLANTADPRASSTSNGAFLRVLQDLGSREAKLLDAIYRDCLERLPANPPWRAPEDVVHSMETLRDIYHKAGLSTRRLARLNVGDAAEKPAELQHQQAEFRMSIDVLERHNLIHKIIAMTGHSGFDGGTNRLTETFRLTAFGSAFIKACLPPRAEI